MHGGHVSSTGVHCLICVSIWFLNSVLENIVTRFVGKDAAIFGKFVVITGEVEAFLFLSAL